MQKCKVPSPVRLRTKKDTVETAINQVKKYLKGNIGKEKLGEKTKGFLKGLILYAKGLYLEGTTEANVALKVNKFKDPKDIDLAKLILNNLRTLSANTDFRNKLLT